MNRQFPLPFRSPELVPAGQDGTATFLTGKYPLRYLQIVLPYTFDVIDFWINGESQLLSEQPIAGYVFHGLQMRSAEIAPDSIVEIMARNLAGEPQLLSGALLCEVLPFRPVDDVARPPAENNAPAPVIVPEQIFVEPKPPEQVS